MPTRLTRVRAAAMSHSVQAVKQPPTAPPWTIDAAVRLPEVLSAASIHMLSTRFAGLHRIDGVDRTLRPIPSVPSSRPAARFSEQSMLAALAGQPVPLGGLTQNGEYRSCPYPCHLPLS
mgnify:CR=1 FL=1